jgi:hypothetical protein
MELLLFQNIEIEPQYLTTVGSLLENCACHLVLYKNRNFVVGKVKKGENEVTIISYCKVYEVQNDVL